MEKYISLAISSFIFLIFLIYSYIKRYNIKNCESLIKNKMLRVFLAPFYYISKENYKLSSFMISAKIKIYMKNLFQKKSNHEEIKLISIKLMYTFYFTLIILILFSFIQNYFILIIGIVFIFLFNSFLDSGIFNLYKLEKEKFKNDLPSYITRLILLINSGIRIRTAINFISENATGEVAKKMTNVKKLVQNGMSEEEAYNTILMNTDDILIRKFISNIINNIKKGGDDIEKTLSLMKKESDEFKKSQTILKTQEANRKLLFPNLLIFMGIMIMVMLPILLNLA